MVERVAISTPGRKTKMILEGVLPTSVFVMCLLAQIIQTQRSMQSMNASAFRFPCLSSATHDSTTSLLEAILPILLDLVLPILPGKTRFPFEKNEQNERLTFFLKKIDRQGKIGVVLMKSEQSSIHLD